MSQPKKVTVEAVTPETLGGLNILLYGPPGHGKTMFATSGYNHPALAKVLVIDIDGGLKSIVHRPDIKRVRCNSSEDVTAVFEMIMRNDPMLNDVNTIVIDSVSAWMEKEKQYIAQREATIGKDANRRTLDTIWLADYKEMTARLKRLVDYFRSLDKTVILTATERDYGPTEDNPNLPLTRRAEMTPGLYNAIAPMVDMIWRVGQTNSEVFLLTQERVYPNGARISAKTRNERFATKLLEQGGTDENGEPNGVIKIGHVGKSHDKYPNLGDFYDWYINSIKEAN